MSKKVDFRNIVIKDINGVAQSPAGKHDDNDNDGKNLWWLAAILIGVGLAIAVITVLI